MEESGHMTFKVPPHGIEFTLPSPKVGIESISVVEPPWMPQVKMNVEEVTLDQIQHVSSSFPFYFIFYCFIYFTETILHYCKSDEKKDSR